MPGYVLHEGATVLCTHGGQARPTSTSPRVKVGSQPVATQTAPYSVSGCPYTLPSGTPSPCVTAQWVVAATRVRVGGAFVLTQSSVATCIPNGTPVNIVTTQTRVKAT